MLSKPQAMFVIYIYMYLLVLPGKIAGFSKHLMANPGPSLARINEKQETPINDSATLLIN